MNTNELLTKLAAQMGTTTEYLWGVLIRQAPISATIDLVQFLVLIAVAVGLFKAHLRLYRDDEDYRSFDSGKSMAMLVVGCVVAFLLIGSFAFSGNIINGYFNPEYWALNKVLDTLK